MLFQQKCAKTLGNTSGLSDTMKPSEKEELLEMVRRLLILNLADNVLRQVDEQDMATKIWSKLDTL